MTTWQIQIKGIVQGVGFRPFVHHLAESLKMEGQVFNNSNGVEIIFNALPEQAQVFYQRLIDAVPALSLVTDHHLKKTSDQDFSGFAIVQSKTSKVDNFRITPDLAMCESCRSEINDPSNRRFGYAFTTCTNCGPRFSILRDLPFDRENTTMCSFQMCDACQQEYNDPTNSRHHSQTNSCSQCGITLRLFNCKTKKYTPEQPPDQLIKTICNQIQQVAIVGVKGIGGFLLICDATNEESVIELRKRKQRPNKPLAVMYPNIEAIQNEYHVSDHETAALQSSIAPIVLLKPKSRPGLSIPCDQVCPGLDRIGVVLPYTPLYELILQKIKSPIIATSGNISGSPIIHSNDTAVKSLSAIADYILTNNREITFPQDDSVIQFATQSQQRIILRRARGLAPNYINPNLKIEMVPTKISLGADLKGSFGVLHNQNILVSQYLGDMSHYEVQENATKDLSRIRKMLDQPIGQVVMDKHPNYHSGQLGTELAKNEQVPVFKVQHHQAHFCAILGEHGLFHFSSRILGVIWDGTGFGDDGHIWGSEFFLLEQKKISRVTHVKYFEAIGGDKLSLEPRLSGLAIGFADADVQVQLKKKFSQEEWRIYTKQLASGGSLESSSMGRLFDAVASILDVTDINTYEAEAAMTLEPFAAQYFYEHHFLALQPYAVFDEQNRLDGAQMLAEILKDLTAGIDKHRIALRFYQTLVHWIDLVAQAQGATKLAFSGGVFQSALLVDMIIELLGHRYELLWHKDFSPNDENIAFGQLVRSQVAQRRNHKS